VGLVAESWTGRGCEGFAGNTSILDLVDTAVRALGRLDPRAIPGLLHRPVSLPFGSFLVGPVVEVALRGSGQFSPDLFLCLQDFLARIVPDPDNSCHRVVDQRLHAVCFHLVRAIV
jgi:hypothetical protein